ELPLCPDREGTPLLRSWQRKCCRSCRNVDLGWGVMARRKLLRRTYSPNQLVALNVARARAMRGWTQEQASAALAPYLGTRWSNASFSAVERSISGARVKQFSA